MWPVKGNKPSVCHIQNKGLYLDILRFFFGEKYSIKKQITMYDVCMIIYIKLTHSGSLLLYQATPLYTLWGGASLTNSMSACPGTSSVSALPVHLLKPYLFVNRSSFLTPLLLLSWHDLHFSSSSDFLSVQSLLGTLKQALFSFAGWWSGFFLLTHDIYIHEYGDLLK